MQTSKGLIQEILKTAINSLTFTFAGEAKISDPIQIGVVALSWLHKVSIWWDQHGKQAFQLMEEPAIEIIKSKIGAAKTNLNSYYDDETHRSILIKSFRALGIWLRKKYIRHDCYPIFQRQIFKWKVNLYLLRNDPAHAFHELDQFVRLYNILLITLPPVLKNAHTITDVHKFDIAKANLRPHGILSKIHLRLSDKHNTPEDYSSLMKSLAELHKDDQWLKDQNTLSSVANFVDPTPTAAGKSVFAFQANTKQSFFNRSFSTKFPWTQTWSWMWSL